MRTLLSLSSFLAVAGMGYATQLSFFGTADDAFEAYISTDDSVAGTLIASGAWWPSTFPGVATLTPGVDHYLHVVARDLFGGPQMFIASLALDDNQFQFGNGLQTLDTDATHWQASLTGFGVDYVAPADLGVNGSAWGLLGGGIAPAAHFIWAGGPSGEHYFSTKIEAVPEPASLAALALGALALGRRKR